MENKIEHFKPDFFVPGAAKSGTTTLHDLLNTHHDISMSKDKEPVYWNNKLFHQFKLFEVLTGTVQRFTNNNSFVDFI